ncbi:hypothetical protein J6590_089629 [Homalodisca vitripennis]|nr:hypothetical protein J6590_089629 [Homalodisca vitripennis]
MLDVTQRERQEAKSRLHAHFTAIIAHSSEGLNKARGRCPSDRTGRGSCGLELPVQMPTSVVLPAVITGIPTVCRQSPNITGFKKIQSAYNCGLGFKCTRDWLSIVGSYCMELTSKVVGGMRLPPRNYGFSPLPSLSTECCPVVDDADVTSED